jgi:hypothetical protein
VRGREKVGVAALLAGSAAATGGLVGFAAGVAWLVAGVGPLPPPAAVAVVVGAAVLDLAARRAPRLAPPSIGRQVPREWSRYFSPQTVAVLYGARLGVGPATMLPSWLWWAMLVLAASAGVGTSVAAGAAFGAARTAVMVGLAEWVRHAAAPRMARVRAAEVAVTALLAPLAVLVVAVAV